MNALRFYSNMAMKAAEYSKHALRQSLFWVKKGRIRNASNFLWDMLFSEEEGAGILAPLYNIFPNFAPYPGRIEVETTNRCNLRCVKCEHTYWGKKVRQKDMTFGEFLHILKQFPNLRDISMSGIGHGFHNRNFIDTYMKMLSHLKKKQVFIQLFDPFITLDEKILREIIKIGVDRIWVSMDAATKRIYEKLQVGSNYDTVIRNLKTLIRLKREMNSLVPELCFNFIIQKGNEKEMPKMLDLMMEIQKDDPSLLRHIRFTKLLRFREVSHLAPQINEKMLDEVRQKAVKIRKTGILLRCDLPGLKRPGIECCTAWTTPFFTVEGTYYPCCGFTEMNHREESKKLLEPVFGNVFRDNFRKIWYSKYSKKFRKDMLQGKVPYVCLKPVPCRTFKVNEWNGYYDDRYDKFK